MEKIIDWKFIKKLDICFESVVREELKNSFIDLLAKLNDDASIKLIPKQSLRYIHEEYSSLAETSFTNEFHGLLAIFSSLNKKNPIDLDCIFSYHPFKAFNFCILLRT